MEKQKKGIDSFAMVTIEVKKEIIQALHSSGFKNPSHEIRINNTVTPYIKAELSSENLTELIEKFNKLGWLFKSKIVTENATYFIFGRFLSQRENT